MSLEAGVGNPTRLPAFDEVERIQGVANQHCHRRVSCSHVSVHDGSVLNGPLHKLRSRQHHTRRAGRTTSSQTKVTAKQASLERTHTVDGSRWNSTKPMK